MNTIPIYILAGGKSSRYGQDKARVLFQGKPLLLHVTGLFGKISNNITVIADKAEKYDDLGVKTISDKIKGQGPLGGLHRAILDCNKNEWLLLSSCDLIGIQTRWLDLLISGIKNNVQAVAFKGDFWEPMPGLYHTASLEVVTRLLTEKRPIWQ